MLLKRHYFKLIIWVGTPGYFIGFLMYIPWGLIILCVFYLLSCGLHILLGKVSVIIFWFLSSYLFYGWIVKWLHIFYFKIHFMFYVLQTISSKWLSFYYYYHYTIVFEEVEIPSCLPTILFSHSYLSCFVISSLNRVVCMIVGLVLSIGAW